ncbi:MAG: AAA family ATPase [Deltaproteobacteria bacterium]|nr:AAA family ATPase [Deltaproteobacteria bacterium]
MTAPRATLAERLADGPLDWSTAARLALEVVEALTERGGAWAGPDRLDPAAVLLETPDAGGPPTLAALGTGEAAAEPESSPVPRGVRAVARLLLAMLGTDETTLAGTEGSLPAPLRPLLDRALRTNDARALATWGGLHEALWNALHLAEPDAALVGTTLPSALVRRVQLEARGRTGTRDAVWCVIRLPDGATAQAVLTVDPEDSGTTHHARTFRGLWPGAELAAWGLPAPAEGSTAERLVFPLRPETLLVLEPRRLFEVTAVASAHEAGCPANFLAGLLEGTGSISPALLGGRMADTALHLLLEHPERTDAAVAGEALRASRVDAAWIRTEAGLTQAEAILRKAVPQLRAWLGRRAAGPETLHEVSRLSLRFGLSGRSDLVFPRPDGPPAVGELKSGQALRYDAPAPVPGAEVAALRPSHATQARLYALLWTDAWRRARPDRADAAAANRIATELFYAGDGKAFRLGPEARELGRSLATRNAMLDLLRRAADGEPLPPPSRFAACDRCWRRASCPCPPDGRPALRGAAAGSGAAPMDVSRAYLEHFARLLLRAVWHAQGERRRSLEPLTLPARAARLAVETGLTLGFDAADPRTARLRGELHGALHPEDGARVRAHRGDPGALEAFEAELARAGRDGYELRLDGPRPPWVPEGPGWLLEAAGGFENERDGFEGLLRARHRGEAPLVADLLGTPTAGGGPSPRIELPRAPFPGGWHPSQAAAFERALNGGPLELVQGPPGTGKTTFVGALVAALVAAGRRVLASALTHNAADLVARRIVEAGATDVLRIGARNDATALRDALAAAGVDPDRAFLESFARRARDARAVRARLHEARVVVSNCHRLGRLPWRHEFRAGGDPPFDVAVLDEATQISEPLALGVLALARRAVLVGDPRQLSCVEPSAREWPPDPPPDPTLAAAGVGPLDRSLHERLCATRPSAMLREQHRMHERIMALPNRTYYGGALEAAPEARTRLLELDLPGDPNRPAWLDAAARPDEPLVLVDVPDGADGRRNEREAARVAEAAALLRRSGLAPERLGVVTPYRAQVALIRRLLASEPELAAIPVDTVERFQGDERDAILVSLVGARPTGHLAHPNRLNVTLTRARSKLVVFGDAAGLSADPVLAELATQAETTVVRAP